jgi:HD superfamily phosphohydrolase
MVEFSDLLYGRIELPDWLGAFLRIPEFVRLRGVRLSNVDSLDFKDFGSVTRWEHGIAVAYLAWRCGEYRRLSVNKRAELTLAALLHDVATPPFAHTAEFVLESFDHELETQRLLSAVASDTSKPDMPVYGSSLPQFQRAIRALAREARIEADSDEIARMVAGDGDLGFLISGTLDLDNADNVTRGCAQMGMEVDRLVPLRVARWLAEQRCEPTNLETQAEPAVQTWLGYRANYYSAFFESSDQELGRQAFLQHLMRRALRSGLPRRSLVWSTDEALLNTISTLQEPKLREGDVALSDLIERYRLMEPTHLIFRVEIEDEDTLRTLRRASAVSWLEESLSSPHLEPFVLVSSRRFAKKGDTYLFLPSVRGALLAFKLGGEIQHRQLPDWLRSRVSEYLTGARLRTAIANALREEMPNWVRARPWLPMTVQRRESVVENLRSAGDWSFRLSRNENLHSYPSTFVHAIPATLINCLGLGGDLILDPFGGTGQTAMEAIKYECQAISSDSNTIASLVARVKLTPLSAQQRNWLRTINSDDLSSTPASDPPEFEARGKWHNPKTLVELCRIWAFAQSVTDEPAKQFLLACFSSIIPASTGRRGKEHGFFADNTPLPAKMEKPPYSNAVELFLARIERNLEIIERFYGFLERSGRNPERELLRARVVQLDACVASPHDYGIEPGSVGGIITSPPYLCMADYSLGLRLSYYWIAPAALKVDFEKEIGARRTRSRPSLAAKNYFSSVEKFAQRAAHLVRSGGFLATVLGSPVAKAFEKVRVLEQIDEIFRAVGFDLLWNQRRRIHWHRNQGYQRLLSERVSVHVRH